MKKTFKGISMAIGFLVALIGLCICSCDAPTMDKQVVNFGIGLAVGVVGAIMICLGFDWKEVQ